MCSRRRPTCGRRTCSTAASVRAERTRARRSGPGAPRHPRSPARLAWLGGRFWQVRLEQPLCRAGRSPGDPADRAAGHAGRRRCLTRRASTAPAAICSPGSRSPAERTRTRGSPHTAAARAAAPHPHRRTAVPTRRSSWSPVAQAGLEPPPDSELDTEDLRALRAAGRAVRVSKTLHYHVGGVGATSASGSSTLRSGMAARSRLPRRATSWRRRANTPRRCSSTSTRSE